MTMMNRLKGDIALDAEKRTTTKQTMLQVLS